MNSKPGAVLVVDDDASVRESLQDLLEATGLAVQTFGSVQAFLDAPRPEGPCCLVLDVRLPGRGGLDLQDELARSDTPLPIVFITGHGDIPMSVRAMKRGAVEFLPKPFREQDLLDAINVGLEQDRLRLQEAQVDAELRRKLDGLTARERQVLVQVAAGKANKVIARDLGVTEITVKVHRGQVMRKTGAGSVADLVRMVDRLGLTVPD
ncbi:MAG TPA: response regulator [Caulobacteraceae bacterium]|jgi:FixJ family two-component response regulator|nr:response regulator [Caulobacteraceae bacterium]